MTNSEELRAVTLSREQLSELIKQKLYSMGYAKTEGAWISHVDFGALQDDTIPVHFWISGDDGKEEYIVYENGKSS